MGMQKLVQEYRRLTRIIARAEKRREKIRRFLKERMKRKGLGVLRFEGLKATLYPTRKVEWDVKKLGSILEMAGVPDSFIEKVFVTSVNEEELNKLVEDGAVDLERVREAGRVRIGHGFRVDEVRGE